MPRPWVLALLGALVLHAARAGAAERPVVAVLYFDNNTGRQELDVLQKGLADMMLTDLSSVESITVVEREKLEALLAELKLQRTKYFDKKSAAKIGRGLGAKYAVTGTYAAVDPQIRIDVRLIEIETGKILVAEKISGEARKLFELQQVLVGKFVGALNVKLRRRPGARGVAPDLDGLLQYSKSVDLADRGELDQARAALQEVIKRAPAFALARAKQEELRKLLARAGERRVEVMSDSAVQLGKNIEAQLARDFAGLDEESAKKYLAYRAARAWMIARAMTPHLAPKGLRFVRRGHEDQVLRLMRAWYANGELFLKELGTYAERFTKVYPNGVVHLDTSFALAPEDRLLAKSAGLDESPSGDPVAVRRTLGEFLLLGRINDGKDWLTVAPPLGELDPSLRDRGYRLLDEAWAAADAALKQNPAHDYPAIMAIESHAEALLLRGQTEAAIQKWQEALDKYPASRRFAFIEKRIQAVLGLAHDAHFSDLARYQRGIEQCEDMDLRVGLDEIFHDRVRVRGIDAIEATVREVEERCKNSSLRPHLWQYLYSHAALYGGGQEDCELFEKMMKKYRDAGGSRSDEAGYRKNWAPKCAAAVP